MNIFEIVKNSIPLVDGISFYAGQVTPCGSDTFEIEDKECPFCGHKDCFKIKDQGVDSFYKCFSCDETGDIISFVQTAFKIENVKDAAMKLVKDFNLDVQVDTPPSPVEKVLWLSMEYYHDKLFSRDTVLKAKGKHPLEYQLENRGHSPEMLSSLKIGFSDGQLNQYLLSIGTPLDDMLDSGMVAKDKYGRLYDYFTPGLFIYPHFVGKRVSSFSQKDPEGKIDYQFPAKFRINNCLFWGQETVKAASKVAVVEGQNDRISILEAGFEGAVLCTCGQLSGKQLEWLRDNVASKQVVSIFDSDDAGNVYRAKFKKAVPEATQIRLELADCKDIDDFLKKHKKSFSEAFEYVVGREVPPPEKIAELEAPEASERPSVSIPSYDRELGLVEKDGAYFKVRRDKEGEETLVRLTDFTIKLKNIFLLDGKRVREAEVIRCDGTKSHPMLIDSETKVSLKMFRAKVADACDANFFGQEGDLLSMWRYIYKHDTEKTVFIPDHIGRVENDGGWLFGNVYLRSNGEVITPDKSGVMWIGGNTRGIRPQSLSDDLEYDIYSHRSRHVPKMMYNLTAEEVDSIECTLVKLYAQNLGDIGKALMILGWAKLNAFSDKLFDEYGFTPFLFLWGGNGTGKTSLLQWILSIYSMKDSGYDTLANLRSGVGFERKLGYYSSLPVCLDELRNSKEMTEFTGRFRAWYNRAGRSMAASGSKKIVQQSIRSNFLFGGQDMFTDDALRERCVVIRINKEGREMKDSYRTLSRMEAQGRLSAVGFKWILESQTQDQNEMLVNIEEWTSKFLDRGCKQRTARVWALIAHFGGGLANKYFPDFDFEGYALDNYSKDVNQQLDNGFINRFFELVEGITFMVNSPITSDHFKVSNNKLFIWFPDVYRIASVFRRDPSEETFTKEAIRSAIKEESYFVKDSVEKTGVTNTSRRVIVIDLDDENIPDSLRNIGEYASTRF